MKKPNKKEFIELLSKISDAFHEKDIETDLMVEIDSMIDAINGIDYYSPEMK